MVKNKKYSWADVTVGQYKRLAALDREDEDYAFNIVAIFEGKTLPEVLNAPIAQTLAQTKALSEFISTTPKIRRIKPEYEINGSVYQMTMNPGEITTAQYFDFSSCPKKIPENLNQVLAILLIPKGKNYNEGYSLEKVAQDIDNMPIEAAFSYANFLRRLFRVSLSLVLKKTKKALKQARKDGVDKQALEKAEAEIQALLDYTKSLKW